MAKRKAISVARATYKNPRPSAKSSTVSKTRAVRESVSSKVLPGRRLHSCRDHLVSDYFCIIGRNIDSHELKVIVIVHKEGPGDVVRGQVQAQEFAVGPVDFHLLLAR